MAARGGPFPEGFQGTHFSTTQCMQCHASALKHTDDFALFRDWYGRVRGTGDGLFSIPIADPSCFSGNGVLYEPVLNRKLVQAGLLEFVR